MRALLIPEDRVSMFVPKPKYKASYPRSDECKNLKSGSTRHVTRIPVVNQETTIPTKMSILQY
jgi:hypothetical protein